MNNDRIIFDKAEFKPPLDTIVSTQGQLAIAWLYAKWDAELRKDVSIGNKPIIKIVSYGYGEHGYSINTGINDKGLVAFLPEYCLNHAIISVRVTKHNTNSVECEPVEWIQLPDATQEHGYLYGMDTGRFEQDFGEIEKGFIWHNKSVKGG